jgi:hypothetical protein
MNTHADTTQDNKSQSVANDFSEKQISCESTFQFVDNRPEAVAQRKIQEIAINSPQVKKAAQLQRMADYHSDQQPKPIQKKENNTGLPDNLKSGIENLSGFSMDDVKVHYHSNKPAQLQAYAFAQGTDIHLASGQEKHLPHEAWHVVQQKQGIVKPTMQLKGKVNLNEDPGLEKEADLMGEKALGLDKNNSLKGNRIGDSSSAIQLKPTGTFISRAVIQRVTTQILPDAEDGKIGGIAIVGRPPNTFSGSMGDHTTAFTAIASGLENQLTGKSIVDASTLLAKLVHQLYQLPGIELRDNLPEEHKTKLNKALEIVHGYVDDFRRFRKSKQQNKAGIFNNPVENEDEYEFSAELVTHMQGWVDAYLEARELVPLSTINTKAIDAALAGKGKGESANALIKSEKDGDFNYESVIKAAIGLFDARSAAVVCLLNNQEELNKIAPGVHDELPFEFKRNMLVMQHIRTLFSLYPNTMNLLDQQDGISELGKNLHQNVNIKAEETINGGQEQKTSQNRGKRAQKEGKRYLTTAISVDENNIIKEIKFGGRGTSPYSNTMGAHTTAWTVLTDVFYSELVGLSLPMATEKIWDISEKAYEDLKKMSSLFQADEKQIHRIQFALGEFGRSQELLIELTKMNKYYEDLQVNDQSQSGEIRIEEDLDFDIQGQQDEENSIEMVDVRENQSSQEDTSMDEITLYSPWEQLLIMQEAINHILNLQNLTPGASLFVGNVNAAREGSYRGILLDFLDQQADEKITFSKEEIQKAIMGLLDLKGLGQHLITTKENLINREKYIYEEGNDKMIDDEDISSEYYEEMKISEPTGYDFYNSLIQLLTHHFEMIKKAYPGALEYSNLDKLDPDQLYQMSLYYSEEKGFEPDEEIDEENY